MITVYHLDHSRSQRILWLLEELGLPYAIERYQRDPKTLLAPPELRKIHPLGKAPIIRDGALTLAESGAIMEYLGDRYGAGALMPLHGTAERLRCSYWLHYAEGSAMPPLLLKLVFQSIGRAPMPFFVRPVVKGIARRVQRAFVDPQIGLHLDYMEDALRDREWFAGDSFSLADIAMSFPIEVAAARHALNAARPRLWAYLRKIHARPAWQRALENGGEYLFSE